MPVPSPAEKRKQAHAPQSRSNLEHRSPQKTETWGVLTPEIWGLTRTVGFVVSVGVETAASSGQEQSVDDTIRQLVPVGLGDANDAVTCPAVQELNKGPAIQLNAGQ